MRIIILLLSVWMLTSCSLLSPVPTPANTYVLNTIPCNVSKHRTHSTILLVLPTESRPIYNTTLMAYSKSPYAISYFSVNEWAETPAQMLQPLIIQTLQDTHYFRAVVGTNEGGRADYQLSTQLLRLKQDFMTHPSVVRLGVRAQLSRVGGRIIATKDFCAVVPVPQETPYGGVIAANKATACVLAQIAEFCVHKMR